jgi:hypothetical protein
MLRYYYTSDRQSGIIATNSKENSYVVCCLLEVVFWVIGNGGPRNFWKSRQTRLSYLILNEIAIENYKLRASLRDG